MSFLGKEELQSIGFRSLGTGVRVSSKCSIYNAANICIGDDSRIDDFCVLSAGKAGIIIGNNVHIACYCSLQGAELIEIEDYANLSSRIAIYSSTDDFSGESLTNPTVPDRYRRVINSPVRLGKHVIIGAGSVVLPGVRIGLGAAIGAMSLVKTDCEPFGIYAGIPAQKIKDRSHNLLELERDHQREVGRE